MVKKDKLEQEESVVSQENAVVQETLSAEDKHHLDMSKVKRQLVLAQAEKALAQNEAAEVSFKYLVLQLYCKYGLTETDGIDDNGNIFRNVKK
jgi:hypothetical protein